MTHDISLVDDSQQKRKQGVKINEKEHERTTDAMGDDVGLSQIL